MYEIGLVRQWAGSSMYICGPFNSRDKAITAMSNGNNSKRPEGVSWMWAQYKEIDRAEGCEEFLPDSPRAKELGLIK